MVKLGPADVTSVGVDCGFLPGSWRIVQRERCSCSYVVFIACNVDLELFISCISYVLMSVLYGIRVQEMMSIEA